MRISYWSSDVCSSDLQDRRDARIVEPAGEIDRRNGGDIGPAARGDHAVLRIDRDDDAAGVVARRLADQLGILEGRGADHDTVNAKRKPAIARRAVADSAAKLHLAFERLQYAFDGLGVDGATGQGPVPITHMHNGGLSLVKNICLTR